MLQADVSQLLKHLGDSQNIDMAYDVDISGEDYTVKSPVQLHLILTAIGDDSVMLNGSIGFEVEATCSRCLAKLKRSFEVNVQEEYRQAAAMMTATAEDMELGAEDFVYAIDSEGHIDLSEAIRQNVIVNLPLRTVCEKGCKVPDVSPAMQEGKLDPRFAALKELKNK